MAPPGNISAYQASLDSAQTCPASQGRSRNTAASPVVLKYVELDHVVPKNPAGPTLEVVTNYCPVLDRFLERNPEYLPLIDADKPGKWHKDVSEEKDPGAATAGQPAEGTPR